MFRTHTCNDLRESDIGKRVKLAGWVETIRDHGGVIFIDLRDNYGVTQLVVNDDSMIKDLPKESVIGIEGTVVKRSEETINEKLATGLVEVKIEKLEVLGKCTKMLPFEIASSTATREDVRLKYRYLDLRNKHIHDNILLRSKIISFLRKEMEEMGFTEIQTPILTASSPEGARDYLVPSRKHKGTFYALPQAPQQFKQLVMVSVFDKYFLAVAGTYCDNGTADQEGFGIARGTFSDTFYYRVGRKSYVKQALAHTACCEKFCYFSIFPYVDTVQVFHNPRPLSKVVH